MDRDDIIVQLTNIGWQEEDIIKVQIFIFCFWFLFQAYRVSQKKELTVKENLTKNWVLLDQIFP